MEKIYYEGSPNTPKVIFDNTKGIIEIRGKSIPENAIKFFQPLIEWLKDYSHNPCDSTKVVLQIDYFNTSSSKCILQVLKVLERISAKHEVIVDWIYRDEDMYEIGEDYQLLIRLPFNMLEL
jgi:SiaC family regulatory phosphoprotein